VYASSFRARARAPRRVSLVVESAGTRRRAPSGFEQAIPGTLVMFTMLVALTSGGISLVLERRLGLLRRLAASPISRASLVGGKWAARLVLALIQIAFAMLAGTVLFRMDWGASLPMVCLLMVAWAAFNASLALVLGSLARSEGQMVGIGIMSSMALGALGGCWWPIEIAPRWMQSFAMLLPTGWMMDALHRLVSFGDAAATVQPHLAALTASTLLLTWAGTKAFRYE
jgi:ABC-type multidrug transport system permease subunit